MEKKEYMSPEMEIVEIIEQSCLLDTSGGDLGSGSLDPGTEPDPRPDRGGSRGIDFED